MIFRREPAHRSTDDGPLRAASGRSAQGRSGLGFSRPLGLLVAGVVVMGGLASCTDDGGSKDSTPTSGSDATVIGSGDRYQATITRTEGGIPHITAKTLAGASFGQGWASGQDRTCDVADQVVKLKGERARWLGPGEEDANINSDVAWLGIGIYERAEADWAKASKGARSLLTAYTAGWNAHLKAVGRDKVTGWCKGEPWVRQIKPVDVYAIARAVALSGSSLQLAGYVATAVPPETASADTTSTSVANLRQPAANEVQGFDPDAFAAGLAAMQPDPLGSNGWAIGKDRSADGGGMLLANPHFPWEGELRFWEVQLTVPGVTDAYGVQLSGLPGIGIGFTEDFGWTHTVSAGNRFTAYRLALKPGSPTTYRYGDGWRDMTPTVHKIEVKGSDGKLTETSRTTWASQYGPIIDFPGFGWSNEATITYRDANIDDDAFIDQYLGMLQAKSFDEFVDVHHKINGVPLFNTIATSADGRAWYADTSATPNLSDKAIADYEASLVSDPIAKVAADNGAVLLDGSNPENEWVTVPGSRSPGLIPPDRQPQMERSDYVFNANDSYWVPNATHLLTGDFSPLQGRQDTPRSPRTRENAAVLDNTSATGPAGTDGKFTLDELADAALLNQGYMARELRADVAARCEAATGPVTVEAVPADEKASGLPAADVDVTAACKVLADWNGLYDLDEPGAPLFREFLGRFDSGDLTAAGPLWAQPFEATKPVTTPSGLAPAPAAPAPDPVLVNLARAVQTLDIAGFEPDSTLRDTQFALRDGTRVPIHGGTGVDGTTNVVSFGSLTSIADPAVVDRKQERLVAGSGLWRIDGETGYPVTFGTSFLMALDFTPDGPRAKSFLTYSDTEDRTAKNYLDATERFSEKKWRDVAFTKADIAKAKVTTVTVKG